MQHRSELQFVAVLTTLVDIVQRPFAGPLKPHPFIERMGAVETGIRPQDRVARSPAPHYPQNHLGPGSLAPNFGDHGPSDSALAASSAWRLRRPGADRHAARCASRDLCSGGAPRRYSPSEVELANRPGLEYFGKTLAELQGWATSDAVHPEDLPQTIAAWRRSVETRQQYDVDHRLRRADGAYRWFHARGLPLRDAEGRTVRWYVLLTDIDDRKQAEEKLRRREESLVEAQRLSHTGSWRHEVASGTVTVSPEIHRIFGITPEETSSAEFWFDRIHPEDRKRIQELFASSEIRKTFYQADYR